MIIFTANHEHIKLLRSPLVAVLGASSVKKYMTQLTNIADDIFDALTDAEKKDCDGEKLSFEFAMTVISKLITGYETTRENYILLAQALNMVSKKMTSVLAQRPFTEDEKRKYQQAIKLVKDVIHNNINASQPSLLILKMRELDWDEFQIRANLFFMYFAATETTASSLNYLLWQLGKNENKHFLEKLRDPIDGDKVLSQLISETLRLHPSSFIQGRQFRTDTLFEAFDPLGKLVKKIRLRREHSVICLPQVAALDSHTFVEPRHFNPNRFDSSDVRSQLTWHPFGAGTHACPGQYLAIAELKAFIARMVATFNIQLLQSESEIEQKGFFTLRATPAHIRLSDL